MKDPEVQKLFGELRMEKKLKEVKLENGLLKYKQCRVYIPHSKVVSLERGI